jgi:hypothetical protein
MSRDRRLKIDGGAFFFTLALADRGSDLLGRVLINSAQCPHRSESDRFAAPPRSDAIGQELHFELQKRASCFAQPAEII